MHKQNQATDILDKLEKSIFSALETYSNVHRGSGHNSLVTTGIYEEARNQVLRYLGLSTGKYVVIFCSPRAAEAFQSQLDQSSYEVLSSKNFGLSLGVRAMAIKKKSLPDGNPFQTGGGTTKLIAREWVIWANPPDKFEAGTPAVINVIAFVKALSLLKQQGLDYLQESTSEDISVNDLLFHDELDGYSGKELFDVLKKNLIGRNFKVPTTEGYSPFINLDNSASTPTFYPIWKVFRETLCLPENKQKEIVDQVKVICSDFLNAPLSEYEVIFSSNTTESINITAESVGHDHDEETETVILNTLLEHSSNDLPWRMIKNASLVRLSVSHEGLIDFIELESILSDYNQEKCFGKKRIKLVAVSGASNVLGVCNNLYEIAALVHKYGAKLLVDAAQLVAHRKVNLEDIGIDFLAFSAHKIYAPFGCGVLVAKKGLLQFSGNEMEKIRSTGQENIAGIAALGKSMSLLQRIGLDVIEQEEQILNEKLLLGMSQMPGLQVFGINSADNIQFNNKLGVVVFQFKGKSPGGTAKKLAMVGGIGVRYGCHCAHLIIKHILNVSPGLEKFQRLIQTVFPRLKFQGLVRISLGLQTSEEDVDQLLKTLHNIAGKGKTDQSLNDTKKKINAFVDERVVRVFIN